MLLMSRAKRAIERIPSSRAGAVFSGLVVSSLIACSGSAGTKAETAPSFEQKKTGELSLDELLAQAKKAELTGDFNLALSLYQKAEDSGHPPEDHARLLLELGKYEQLIEEGKGSSISELRLLRAQALRSLGRVEEALLQLGEILGPEKEGALPAVCPANGAKPLSLVKTRSLLLRGELELEQGQRPNANQTLGQLVSCAEAVRSRAPVHLVYAGQAAALMRKYELANELFNEAETQLDAKKYEGEYRDLLLYRGWLFLEKNDHAQANTIAEELSKEWPHRLQVRLFHAHIMAETRFDFGGAEEEAAQILEINPRLAPALFILAGIQLRDMNLGAARAFVDRGLAVNPRDLDLLSMQAAVLFLSEEREAFENQLEAIARLSPGNVRPYLVVAEYAEWEHRYPDIEKLMRRAARLDREAAEVRSRLGLTLVRAGSDAAGIVELRRAYDLDPYNIRVINTLNLYEKIVPRDYVSYEKGPFRYRFPKQEAELLKRYVPALMEQGFSEMEKRYGFTPPSPIDVELYEEPSQFAVRTSGVPSIGIQGVCFGHKLATVSPVGSPGNLGMTLWHELGHVFHIGLSGYRVPRYLTEGLAEWETLRRKVGWSRELDRELHEVRARGGLPSLSQMSRAFTHASGVQDVAAAYYASGILSEWLVDRFGEKKIVQALSVMGQGKIASDVIPEVLGASWAELDTAFSTHLDEHLRYLEGQFIPRVPSQASDLVRPQLKEHPNDPELELALALALLAEGEIKEARGILEQLYEKKNQQAAYALIRVALAEENKKKARGFLQELFSSGVDGYELRMLSARLYLAQQSKEQAAAELERALHFDPSSEEVRQMLVRYYRSENRAEAELTQVRAWAHHSEHDPAAHQRFLELLLELGHTEEAAAEARLAVWVDLAGIETHRLAGLAFAKDRKWKEAEYEWESALLCPAEPDQLVRVAETWTSELKKVGRTSEAARVEKRVGELIETSLQRRMKK